MRAQVVGVSLFVGSDVIVWFRRAVPLLPDYVVGVRFMTHGPQARQLIVITAKAKKGQS